MATAAEVKFVNRVLHLLGQEPVADLSEEQLAQSNAALKVSRAMDEARDTVLARHGWVCALEYATLNAVQQPGYSNWRYPGLFMLPGNGLRVWEIEGESEGRWGLRWQAGSLETGAGAKKIIRAVSTAPLNVAYVRRANWAALDPHVFDAAAHDCAARCAATVAGEEQAQVARRAALAENKVVLAVSVDGTQEGGQPPLTPSIPEQIRNLARC